MRLLGFLAAAALLAGEPGLEANGATYVGADRCKLCHRDLYESWAATPHARAGVRVEGAPERCLSCHATSGRELASVQCEACHGPGSDYSPPEVMIDPEKAAMAGLVRVSIATCERCHVNDEPGHQKDLVMPSRAEWSRWIHDVKQP